VSFEEEIQVVSVDEEGDRRTSDFPSLQTTANQRLENAHTAQEGTFIIAHRYCETGRLVCRLVVHRSHISSSDTRSGCQHGALAAGFSSRFPSFGNMRGPTIPEQIVAQAIFRNGRNRVRFRGYEWV
jgi:hypothetical protein